MTTKLVTCFGNQACTLDRTPCLPYAFVLHTLCVTNVQEKTDQNYLAHGLHQRQRTTSGVLTSPCIKAA